MNISSVTRTWLLALLAVIGSTLPAADYQVYGSRPVDSAFDGKPTLLTGVLAADLGLGAAQATVGMPLRVVVDVIKENGFPTGQYRVREVWADDESVRQLATWGEGLGPVFLADATVLADAYWISDANTLVNRVLVKTGVIFRSETELAAFSIDAFIHGPSKNRRVKAEVIPAATLIDGGQVRFSSTTPITKTGADAFPGAWVAAYDLSGTLYIFRESRLVYTSPSMWDPVLQDGQFIQVPLAAMNMDGRLAFSYTRGDGKTLYAAGDPADSLDQSQLPAEHLAKLMPFAAAQTPDVVVKTSAPQRTEEVQELYTAATKALSSPSSEDATSVYGLGPAMAGTGLFSYVDGELQVINGGDLSSGIGSNSLEEQRNALPNSATYLNRLQAQKNIDLVQLAPVMNDTSNMTDGQSLRTKIMEVESYMALQQPQTQALRGASLYRKSEMLAAGTYPSYFSGNTSPGDGNNPKEPQPSAHGPTGAPAYDLDGDHDLDRYNTSDPFDDGYRWLQLDWNVSNNHFRLGDNTGKDCTFAVWGVTTKAQKDLLLVGRDIALFRCDQARWSGRTYYTYALNSLLDPLPQEHTYRFGLRYSGPSVVNNAGDQKPTPEVVQDSGTITQSFVLGDNTVLTGPLEVWSETAYLYPTLVDLGILDPVTMATAAYSDPAFMPRTIVGKPYGGAKFVRMWTPYTVVNGIFVAGTQQTKVVYFPADFREEQLVNEGSSLVANVENAFRWDYRNEGDGMPWNYRRGKQFPKVGLGVALNESDIVQRYGGNQPKLTLTGIITSATQGVGFTVKEVAEANPVYAAGMTAGERDLVNANWIKQRAMSHSPFDDRTDMQPGKDYVNPQGSRLLEIIEGVGFYIFKGKRQDYASAAEQAELLKQMWAWMTWQPPTVYKLLHVDNDDSKPLLNTVRALTEAEGPIGNGVSGKLSEEIHAGGSDRNANVQRRANLIARNVYVFSAARGRELEVEWALKQPKNTILYCTEYETQESVEALFQQTGHEVVFLDSVDRERRALGEFNERIFGRNNLLGRLTPTGGKISVVGDGGIMDALEKEHGAYVFSGSDMQYDKPACRLANVALLDNLQYGDPRSDQWHGEWMVEYRHPMLIMYDDRVSALIVAYGANTNPEEWVGRWNDYHSPVSGEGLGYDPNERAAFEAWSSRPRLESVYDALNKPAYDSAKAGNVTIPEAPKEVAIPVMPRKPDEWTGNPVIAPVAVKDPGQPPTAIDPVWTRTRAAWYADSSLNGLYGTARSNVSGLTAWSSVFGLEYPLGVARDNWVNQFGYAGFIEDVGPKTETYAKGVSATPTVPPATNNQTLFTIGSGANRKTIVLDQAISPSALAPGTHSYTGKIQSTGVPGVLRLTKTSTPNNRGPYTITYGYVWKGNGVKNWGIGSEREYGFVLGDQRHYVATGVTGDYPELASGFSAGQPYQNVFSSYTTATVTFNLEVPIDVALIALSYDDTQVYLDGALLDRYNGDFDWTGPIDRNYTRELAPGLHTFQVTSDGNNTGKAARGLLVKIPSLRDRAKLIADADYAAYSAYLEARDEYNRKKEAYQQYEAEYSVYQALKSQYEQWLAVYQVDMERYQQEMVAYDRKLEAYQRYLAEKAAWDTTVAPLVPLKKIWDDYVAGRTAWVFLVESEIAEAGVAWHEGDPIFAGFSWWQANVPH